MANWKQQLTLNFKGTSNHSERAERAIAAVNAFSRSLNRRAERVRERRGALTEQQMFDYDTGGDLLDVVEVFETAKESGNVEDLDGALAALYDFGDRGHRLWVTIERDR